MKIGRNDPCFCGSGKKYKHCCLEAPAANEPSLASLEELNEYAAEAMEQQNQWALAEFCGLSPEQMSHLLYAPFTSPQTVRFAPDFEPAADSRVMRIFIALVESIGETGLKPTAKGNLPLKFCKALAQQLADEVEENRRFRIGGIRSEEDVDELHCTRLLAELAGFIRKYRGKFVLTRKCRDMLAGQDMGGLYMELFKAYTKKFNWAYRDGHPEAEIVQMSCFYTLFLLASFGDAPRSRQFYEQKFITAFPMVLEMFPESPYDTLERSASHCYFLRALDRFASFFGLVELKWESKGYYPEDCEVRKSPLLDRFVTFNPPRAQEGHQ